MQYASECRIEAGSTHCGSGATSQPKSVIVRNVGTTLRDSISIPSVPFRNRVSKSSASASSSVGVTPCFVRRSKNACIACRSFV